MPGKKEKPQKLKIGQLAKTAGVSVSTIKFYLKEGLIDPPAPGEGSMSYYSEEHVNRIQLIKKLQKERFFPLSVIRKVISTRSVAEETAAPENPEETAWEPIVHGEAITTDAAIARSGYPLEKIEQREKEGFIHPRTTLQGRLFEPVDVDILMLFRAREDAGLPFDHTRQVFSIYKRHMQKAVNEDLMLCMRKVLLQQEGADLINYATEGEKTAEAYVNLCKIKYTRMRVDSMLVRHETIPIRIVEALNLTAALPATRSG